MVIVVTGGTSGIGNAICNYLFSKGNRVYSLARRDFSDGNIVYLKCDITKKQEIINCFTEIYEKEKCIDVVINNAGMGISGALEYHSELELDKIINVNLKGTIMISQIAISYLRESKGKIINIGSVAGELAIPFQTMYSVTKAGVHAFSAALQNELRPFGIKVVCLMPGDTKTSFTANREKNETNSFYGSRIEKSITKMEKDERNGTDPLKVAKVVYKVIKSKNPKTMIAIGANYKMFVFIKKILPIKFVQYVLYKIYG